MKNEDIKITPVEGIDSYRDTAVQYLVSIDVNVGGRYDDRTSPTSH